ncbi:hypothetical protein M595_4987 [Lyngbya aestuarii BL J]|uniref:Uncharacterized protein n=1 Tax=Lyngbya aestuarii BL J TaxID=1348334 RepID=U7QB42_9CYAN|nr:hypothetical protein [Lyngbya aestuarii]ERT05074.1 hypothetical protein M595_4987 [Lyngbya aestuarii BL J]
MFNSNYNPKESQMLEIIQALHCLQKAENHLLKLKALLQAEEDSSEIEANSVPQIIGEALKTQQAKSKKNAEFCENRKKALILAQIEKAGIELTPGLKSLIKNSDCQNLQNALEIYETVYSNRQVYNSAGLFYTILNNENQGR